ncbi:uncharacterized protein [Antedon mediterranea]|uniref:uncharacterized protein n=1 Tax=Antedon mediterranea TaxID=105859 RepID=UPI003AF8CBD6
MNVKKSVFYQQENQRTMNYAVNGYCAMPDRNNVRNPVEKEKNIPKMTDGMVPVQLYGMHAVHGNANLINNDMLPNMQYNVNYQATTNYEGTMYSRTPVYNIQGNSITSKNLPKMNYEGTMYSTPVLNTPGNSSITSKNMPKMNYEGNIYSTPVHNTPGNSSITSKNLPKMNYEGTMYSTPVHNTPGNSSITSKNLPKMNYEGTMYSTPVHNTPGNSSITSKNMAKMNYEGTMYSTPVHNTPGNSSITSKNLPKMNYEGTMYSTPVHNTPGNSSITSKNMAKMNYEGNIYSTPVHNTPGNSSITSKDMPKMNYERTLYSTPSYNTPANSSNPINSHQNTNYIYMPTVINMQSAHSLPQGCGKFSASVIHPKQEDFFYDKNKLEKTLQQANSLCLSFNSETLKDLGRSKAMTNPPTMRDTRVNKSVVPVIVDVQSLAPDIQTSNIAKIYIKGETHHPFYQNNCTVLKQPSENIKFKSKLNTQHGRKELQLPSLNTDSRNELLKTYSMNNNMVTYLSNQLQSSKERNKQHYDYNTSLARTKQVSVKEPTYKQPSPTLTVRDLRQKSSTEMCAQNLIVQDSPNALPNVCYSFDSDNKKTVDDSNVYKNRSDSLLQLQQYGTDQGDYSKYQLTTIHKQKNSIHCSSPFDYESVHYKNETYANYKNKKFQQGLLVQKAAESKGQLISALQKKPVLNYASEKQILTNSVQCIANEHKSQSINTVSVKTEPSEAVSTSTDNKKKCLDMQNVPCRKQVQMSIVNYFQKQTKEVMIFSEDKCRIKGESCTNSQSHQDSYNLPYTQPVSADKYSNCNYKINRSDTMLHRENVLMSEGNNSVNLKLCSPFMPRDLKQTSPNAHQKHPNVGLHKDQMQTSAGEYIKTNIRKQTSPYEERMNERELIPVHSEESISIYQSKKGSTQRNPDCTSANQSCASDQTNEISSSNNISSTNYSNNQIMQSSLTLSHEESMPITGGRHCANNPVHQLADDQCATSPVNHLDSVQSYEKCLKSPDVPGNQLVLSKSCEKSHTSCISNDIHHQLQIQQSDKDSSKYLTLEKVQIMQDKPENSLCLKNSSIPKTTVCKEVLNDKNTKELSISKYTCTLKQTLKTNKLKITFRKEATPLDADYSIINKMNCKETKTSSPVLFYKKGDCLTTLMHNMSATNMPADVSELLDEKESDKLFFPNIRVIADKLPPYFDYQTHLSTENTRASIADKLNKNKTDDEILPKYHGRKRVQDLTLTSNDGILKKPKYGIESTRSSAQELSEELETSDNVKEPENKGTIEAIPNHSETKTDFEIVEFRQKTHGINKTPCLHEVNEIVTREGLKHSSLDNFQNKVTKPNITPNQIETNRKYSIHSNMQYLPSDSQENTKFQPDKISSLTNLNNNNIEKKKTACVHPFKDLIRKYNSEEKNRKQQLSKISDDEKAALKEDNFKRQSVLPGCSKVRYGGVPIQRLVKMSFYGVEIPCITRYDKPFLPLNYIHRRFFRKKPLTQFRRVIKELRINKREMSVAEQKLLETILRKYNIKSSKLIMFSEFVQHFERIHKNMEQ